MLLLVFELFLRVYVCLCPVFLFFPECVARVPVSLGGLGVRLCSPSFAFATATVRNRLRDRCKALHSGECVWSGPESVSSGLFVAAIILVSAEEVSV